MSCVMRKHALCIHAKNKGTYLLPGNCAADQHLCFHYIDRTIPILSKVHMKKDCTIRVAKTKALITQLICGFVFALCKMPVFSGCGSISRL